jgi:hypothetical protein
MVVISLPQLRESAASLLKKIREEISQLPPPPSSTPFAELSKMIREYADSVTAHVIASGIKDHKGLINDCRWNVYYPLKNTFAATCPTFIPCTEWELTQWRTGSWRMPFIADDDHPVQQENERYLLRDAPDPLGWKMNIDGVRSHIKEFVISREVAEQALTHCSFVTREVAGFTPYDAMVNLFERCIERWEMIALLAFEQVHEMASVRFFELCSEKFERHSLLLVRVQ